MAIETLVPNFSSELVTMQIVQYGMKFSTIGFVWKTSLKQTEFLGRFQCFSFTCAGHAKPMKKENNCTNLCDYYRKSSMKRGVNVNLLGFLFLILNARSFVWNTNTKREWKPKKFILRWQNVTLIRIRFIQLNTKTSKHIGLIVQLQIFVSFLHHLLSAYSSWAQSIKFSNGALQDRKWHDIRNEKIVNTCAKQRSQQSNYYYCSKLLNKNAIFHSPTNSLDRIHMAELACDTLLSCQFWYVCDENQNQRKNNPP